jgi:hypothetical protein
VRTFGQKGITSVQISLTRDTKPDWNRIQPAEQRSPAQLFGTHLEQWTGRGLLVLGAGAAASALLGPLALKVIDYHTSQDMLNQFKGADLATLAVVAPAAVGAGLLWLRRHPLAPIASLAPAAYAVYTFTQAILGQDYALYEGNSERFFPLQLGLVVLGGALTLRSWSAIDGRSLPAPSRRLRRTATAVFLGSAAFLTFGPARAWRREVPGATEDAGRLSVQAAMTTAEGPDGPSIFCLCALN